MESDNVNIRDVYFTSNIELWEGHLNDDAIDISNNRSFFETTNSTLFDYDFTNKIVKLKQDLSSNNSWFHLSGISSGENLSYIHLLDGWTFDGSGHTIHLNDDSTDTCKLSGLFSSGASDISNAPTIKNLTVTSGTASSTNIGISLGGIIIRAQQQYFIVDNCHTDGIIDRRNDKQGSICGGYAGYNGGHAIIKNCSNSSKSIFIMSDHHGGIAGAFAGNKGVCKIYNSTNNLNLGSRPKTGGIVGSNAGSGSDTEPGYCLISSCTNNGNFGQYSGGIVGQNSANKGTCKIINCDNSGNMAGNYSGGIVGYRGAKNGGTIIINNCHNTADIVQGYSGGLVGPQAAIHTNSVITVQNSSNTGSITAIGAGGFFGEKACSSGSTQHGTINVTNCFNNSTISNHSSGGFFGKSASGSINIDSCYSICDMTYNDSTYSCFFGSELGAMTGSSSIAKIKVTRSYIINTNSTTSNRSGFFCGVTTSSDKYYQILISHCYGTGCDRGLVNLDQSLSDYGYFVITNSYNNSDNICTLTSSESNTSNITINNSYSNDGTGSNPKNASTDSTTGNYDFDGDITNSSTFDSSKLNDVTTLSTIQSWYTDFSLTPPQDSDIFVYDSGVLLSNFQGSPWSGYTEYNSTPSIESIVNFTTTTSYTVGAVTLPVGHIIVHSFSDEDAFSDWINCEGNNPGTIVDVNISNGIPIFTTNDVPGTGSKSFITDKDYIVFQTDNGDVSYNFEDEIGSNYTHTIDETNYKISFIFVGSGGGIIENLGGNTPSSGGDPHIIPLGQNKIYDLPCKHGANYQYLAYKKYSETVVVNVMTQIVTFNEPNNKKLLTENVKKFISSCRDYIRYMYICYTNKDTGVKEEVCYDLFRLKFVSTNIRHFDTLAYKCILPINKKAIKNHENIKLHKKILKNRKIVGYKTKNKEEQFITVYTNHSKFDIMVGQAKNNLFGTYMSIDKYPQDIFINGGGLLVHPTKTRPINSLKSSDNQYSYRKYLINKH